MKKYLCLMVATLVLSIMAGTIVGCGEQQQKVTVIGSCEGSQALECWSAFRNAQTNRQEFDSITEGDWAYYSCPASGIYNFNLSMITSQDMIDDPSWGDMLVNMSPPLGGMTCECKLHLDKSEWEHLQTNLQTCEFEVVGGGE